MCCTAVGCRRHSGCWGAPTATPLPSPLSRPSQIFKYDGTLLYREKRDVLYEAAWMPTPPGTFEDRPQSPRAAAGAGAAADGGAAAALPAQPVRAAGYVPPHQRGKPGAVAAAAATFSLARDASDTGGKISQGQLAARVMAGGGAAASKLPPGAAPPPSKSASKNAKRRAAAKKKEAGDA